jgi:hypothetical protein
MGYIHDPFCCIAAHTTSDYLLVGLVAKILGKIRMLGHFATVARTGRSMVIGAWSEIRSAGEVLRSIIVCGRQGATASTNCRIF